MKVIKRNGDEVPMLFDKVTARLRKLCEAGPHGPKLDVQPDRVAQKVFSNSLRLKMSCQPRFIW